MRPDWPLEKPSIEDKLSVIELISDSLLNDSQNLAAPDWHHDVLSERSATLARGDIADMDWERLRDQLYLERKRRFAS